MEPPLTPFRFRLILQQMGSTIKALTLVFFLHAILIQTILTGCAQSRIDLDASNEKTFKNLLTIKGQWVKDLKHSYQLLVALTNDSDKSLSFRTKDFQCFRGKSHGSISNDFVQAGIASVVLDPGEKNTQLVKCSFGTPKTGPFRLRIKKLFHNLDDNGQIGDLLIKNISWTYPKK